MSQIFRAVGPLREILKAQFFSSLGLEAERDFDHRISKLTPHSVTASERYLNNKNPNHGRETASIDFRSSAESFSMLFVNT